MKLTETKLRQIIREEIKNHLFTNESIYESKKSINEGISILDIKKKIGQPPKNTDLRDVNGQIYVYYHSKDSKSSKYADEVTKVVRRPVKIDLDKKQESLNKITEKKITDFETGDIVHHEKNNEIGTVLKQYGRRVHVKFSRTGEKTVDFNDLKKLDESVTELFIPQVGQIDDFQLKKLLLKNPKILSALGSNELTFAKNPNTVVIMHQSKRFNTIFTDGKMEFEVNSKDGTLVTPLRKARKKIVSYFSKNENNINNLNEKKITDFERGDIVHHKKNNEIGTVLTQYGRRVHVKFSRTGEKTVNHDEIRKIHDENINENRLPLQLERIKTEFVNHIRKYNKVGSFGKSLTDKLDIVLMGVRPHHKDASKYEHSDPVLFLTIEDSRGNRLIETGLVDFGSFDKTNIEKGVDTAMKELVKLVSKSKIKTQ